MYLSTKTSQDCVASGLARSRNSLTPEISLYLCFPLIGSTLRHASYLVAR